LNFGKKRKEQVKFETLVCVGVVSINLDAVLYLFLVLLSNQDYSFTSTVQVWIWGLSIWSFNFRLFGTLIRSELEFHVHWRVLDHSETPILRVFGGVIWWELKFHEWNDELHEGCETQILIGGWHQSIWGTVFRFCGSSCCCIYIGCSSLGLVCDLKKVKVFGGKGFG